MASYYLIIDGVKHDRELVEMADKLTAGQGDGCLSSYDAAQLLEAIKDGACYTDVDKQTVRYLREHYKWTGLAYEWFRTEIRKYAAEQPYDIIADDFLS